MKTIILNIFLEAEKSQRVIVDLDKLLCSNNLKVHRKLVQSVPPTSLNGFY